MNYKRILHQTLTGVLAITLTGNSFSEVPILPQGRRKSQEIVLQQIEKDAKALTLKIAKYLGERKRADDFRGVINQIYSGESEIIDKNTGEDITDKLTQNTHDIVIDGKLITIGSIDTENLPPNAVVNHFTKSSISLVTDNFLLVAEAKIYEDNKSNRNYGDKRNSLEISCSESPEIARKAIESQNYEIPSLKKILGTQIVDKGLKGLVDTSKDQTAQQKYLRCLKFLEGEYERVK